MNLNDVNKVRSLIKEREELIEKLSMINQYALLVVSKEGTARLQFDQILLKKEPYDDDPMRAMMRAMAYHSHKIKPPQQAEELTINSVRAIDLDETLLLKIIEVIRNHVIDKLSEINQELKALGIQL